MMFIQQKLNLFYFFLLFLSLFFTIACFFVWNGQSSQPQNLKGVPLLHFSVERCRVRAHQIYVMGWVYDPDKPDMVVRIFAENQNGSLVPLMANTRGKIQSQFLDKQKRTRFVASRIFLERNDLSRMIFIMVTNDRDESYVAKYYCK